MLSPRSKAGAVGEPLYMTNMGKALQRLPVPILDQGIVHTVAALSVAGRRRRVLADLAYIVLTTTGWLAGNLLGILGCVVAIFIVISHGHVDTFFLHLDNLASRYNAADLGRRAAFEHQLVQVFVVVLIVTLAVRGPVFVARLRRTLREGQGA